MNIAAFLHATARCFPNAPALSFGDELIHRYVGLQERVARLAGGLRALATYGPRLWQGYGQGETPNTITCMSKAMHVDDGHPRFEQRLASVGVARSGVEVPLVGEDGFLTLKDRSKDVIISGGSNIYPREVEDVLLQHAGVLEVSVVGRHHQDWGEEVIAFVVPKPGQAVNDHVLDQLCLDNIARFKRPKQYVHIDELPKNSYGKVLKTELRTRLPRD